MEQINNSLHDDACRANLFFPFFYIHRSYGDSTHCRKALHRAVQCTSDYPEHVCEVLLTFERVEGRACYKTKLEQRGRKNINNCSVCGYLVLQYKLFSFVICLMTIVE